MNVNSSDFDPGEGFMPDHEGGYRSVDGEEYNPYEDDDGDNRVSDRRYVVTFEVANIYGATLVGKTVCYYLSI
jgi:hypothetical protein